jgi:predicted nucleic acid-binding protein
MLKTDAEPVFVDTNVLLAATDRSRARHAESLACLEAAEKGHARVFTSGQVLREYLVVATRPVAANGLGLRPDQACANLKALQQIVRLLDESTTVATRLLALVEAHRLHGKRIHDASIVATMQAHGLSRLKTWNPEDFAVFSAIHLV